MGGLTMNLPDLVLMQWLLVRYVPPDVSKHLVPPALFGVVVLLGRIFEGASNPPIANLSDHCRSRWGRRLPFIRFGIVPLALVFFLLFHPPVDHLHWINAVFVIVVLPMHALLYVSNVTPYLSLLPEITSDLKERVDLTTFQSVFIMLGTFVFASLGQVLERWGWSGLSGLCAALMIIFFIPVATVIRERPKPLGTEQRNLKLFESIRLALRNRPFVFVITSTALYWFGLNGVIALVPHWTAAALFKSEGAVPMLMVPFLVMNLVFFFVFNALTRRFGKYPLMIVTFVGSGVVILGLCLVGTVPLGSTLVQTMVILAAFGMPVAGFMVLPFAILSDVIDYDERLTGRRREAIFFGVQGIAQRTMVGLSVLTFTIVPYFKSDGSRTLIENGALAISERYVPVANTEASPPDAAPASLTQLEPGQVRVAPEPASLDAPWTLTGPDGFTRTGHGVETLTDLAPGRYRIAWGEVPGWQAPRPPRTVTPFGLKLMAMLCGLFCMLGCLLFLPYPIRERDGKLFVLGVDDR